jgi:nitroreductase
VKDPVKLRALGQASNGQDFVGTAPVIIVVVASDVEWLMPCGVPGYGVDLAIVSEHIVLAAADEGLGRCWIGDFSEKRVKEILPFRINI